VSKRTIMYYVGATVLLAFIIYGYVSWSGDTRPIIMKDQISSFIATVQPYMQNPLLILEWLKANYWVSGFITGGILLGGGVVNWIRGKTTQTAVKVAKESVAGNFKGDIQTLTTEKAQIQDDFNTMLDKLEKKQEIINKQDEVIKAVDEEKKIQEGFVKERDQQIMRLREEARLRETKINDLETKLKIERGEIQEPIP